jgi:hypothetical protein
VSCNYTDSHPEIRREVAAAFGVYDVVVKKLGRGRIRIGLCMYTLSYTSNTGKYRLFSKYPLRGTPGLHIRMQAKKTYGEADVYFPVSPVCKRHKHRLPSWGPGPSQCTQDILVFHCVLMPFLGLDGSCWCVVLAAAANIPYGGKRGGTTIVITTLPRQHGAISYATRDCLFSCT